MAFSKEDEKLFLDLQPDVLRYCKSLTRNPGKAEDLCQATYLKAWAKSHKYESGTNLKPWLMMIARNQFFDDLRKENRHHGYRYGQRPAYPDVESIPAFPTQEGSVELREVLFAIKSLHPDTVKTMFMVAVEGYSYEEAAMAMERPVGTIKSKVFRGRNDLAAYNPHAIYDADDEWADRLVKKLFEVPPP